MQKVFLEYFFLHHMIRYLMNILPCIMALTTEFKTLAKSRDKLKTAAVRNKSSLLMDSYKQLRNKANKLK